MQFISKDPAKADGEMSAYMYCNDDPVNNVDPEGLWGWGSIWGAVKKVVRNVVRTVRHVAKTVVRAVVRTAKKVARAVKKAVKRVVKKVRSVVRHVVRAVKRVYHSAKKYVSSSTKKKPSAKPKKKAAGKAKKTAIDAEANAQKTVAAGVGALPGWAKGGLEWVLGVEDTGDPMSVDERWGALKSGSADVVAGHATAALGSAMVDAAVVEAAAAIPTWGTTAAAVPTTGALGVGMMVAGGMQLIGGYATLYSWAIGRKVRTKTKGGILGLTVKAARYAL